ncbi:hypothetical protein ZWY2020_052830 [Hordeum vulgare]|nr:hypothetical protein ZWY2020_052830 [Hordeum vulgare]
MSYLDCKSLETLFRMKWHAASNITKQYCGLPRGEIQYLDVSFFYGFGIQIMPKSTYYVDKLMLSSMTVKGYGGWRVKQRDIEEWMRHRQLPWSSRSASGGSSEYKWLAATRGVDEESILQSLPLDLRREIQRHLCLALVQRVRSCPSSRQMDEQLLDAICERLNIVALSTKDAYIVREGRPRRQDALHHPRRAGLRARSDGRQAHQFLQLHHAPARKDFCGEGAPDVGADAQPEPQLPTSPRTVRVSDRVEAFALRAEDLKYVLPSGSSASTAKRLQHAFRYYSTEWPELGRLLRCRAHGGGTRRKLAKGAREAGGIL